LTTGALIGFVFLTYRFLEPIAEITEVLFQTQTAVSGLKRVLGVLAIPVGPPQSDSPIPLPVGALDIDIRNVGFTYQTREVGDRGSLEVPALEGVNALIAFGSRVAVVGETGSGKTTLGRLLGRFSDPTVGGITLGGVALTMVANDELRKRVVVVPQEPFLFDDTIGNNLRFVKPSVSDQQLCDVFGALGLEDWLTALEHGLESVVGQRGAQLSSGERQLIALVRASLVDPAILVLDEATSSVDAVTELRLGRAMEKISQGRTTISIAHRLSTAKRADRILVLNQGRLVEDGSHLDLVDAGGTYASMYSSWITATDTSEDKKTFPEMR
jgi:putative ABC transport system ATP-binding protein